MECRIYLLYMFETEDAVIGANPLFEFLLKGASIGVLNPCLVMSICFWLLQFGESGKQRVLFG